jgi:cell fate (sporulation/competence/biofilm development) regulator YlbF (YheA/YmcA/DUF963 family)
MSAGAQRTTADARDEVRRSTDEFIGALRATPAVRRYAEAADRFAADQEVQSFIGTIQEWQRAQRSGVASSIGLQEVRETQVRLRDHRVVQDYLAAREAAGVLLQETNLAISELLGLDFGQTAGPAGGCG